MARSKGLTAKRSRFENVGAGVFSNYSSGFYIADDTFVGRNDPKHLHRMGGRDVTKFRGVPRSPPARASLTAHPSGDRPVPVYGPRPLPR